MVARFSFLFASPVKSAFNLNLQNLKKGVMILRVLLVSLSETLNQHCIINITLNESNQLGGTAGKSEHICHVVMMSC